MNARVITVSNRLHFFFKTMPAGPPPPPFYLADDDNNYDLTGKDDASGASQVERIVLPLNFVFPNIQTDERALLFGSPWLL